MSAIVKGLLDWSADRDDQGTREYKALWLVKTTTPLDGPASVFNASGLPAIGTAWAIDNDLDPWVFCRPKAKIQRHMALLGDPHVWWTIEQSFASPNRRGIDERCNNTQVDDPLSEPEKVSGSFVKYTKEARTRRDGTAILSACGQHVGGIEVDDVTATVIIERNSLSLGLDQFSQFINTLNDSTVWNMPARHVKFDALTWERKYYGSCFVYYTHRMEFLVKSDGFDLDDIVDMGVMHFDSEDLPTTLDGTGRQLRVKGYTNNLTNRKNPSMYVLNRDPAGNAIVDPLPLSRNEDTGQTSTKGMWGDLTPDPHVEGHISFIPTVDYYNESNFYALGIPSTL